MFKGFKQGFGLVIGVAAGLLAVSIVSQYGPEWVYKAKRATMNIAGNMGEKMQDFGVNMQQDAETEVFDEEV